MGYLSRGKSFLENLALKLGRATIQHLHVTKQEQPFVEVRLQFGLRFMELKQLQIDIGQLMVKNALRVLVIQHHLVMQQVIVQRGLVEYEVEQAYRIDGLQFKIPVVSAFGLLAYRKGGIEYAPVLEIILFGFLHLHDELLAALVLAIHIEDGLAVERSFPQLLGGEKSQRRDTGLFGQYRIQEINQKVFVYLCAEQFFETEIGKGVDVSANDILLLSKHYNNKGRNSGWIYKQYGGIMNGAATVIMYIRPAEYKLALRIDLCYQVFAYIRIKLVRFYV